MLRITALPSRSKSLTPSLQPTVKKISEHMQTVNQSRAEFSTGIEDYEFIRPLGKGSFGTVRLAKNRASGAKVAIKSYEKATPQVIRNIRNEVKVLSYLDHPSIVKLLDVRQDGSTVHLIMEYAQGSSLSSFIKSRGLDLQETSKIFRQILAAVCYCHQIGVVHRDLKLTNIIIDSAKRVKILDFGFAAIAHEGLLKMYCGTREFMAPEIALQKPYNGEKVDVWALGVILFVMLTKTYPFVGRNDREMLRKIALVGPQNVAKVPGEARMLVSKMLSYDPAHRVTALEAINDSFFASAKLQTYSVYDVHYEH
jgi:MAP/microtubule affinity-regulating kinase